MKMMYIDCGMGAAGDMLTGALLDLLDEDARAGFIEEFNGLGLPGIVMEAEPSVKRGVSGTRVHIRVNGVEEDEHLHDGHHVHHTHDHEHTQNDAHNTHADSNTDDSHHSHDGAHAHTHRGIAGVKHIVESHLDVPANVKEDILAVYDIIADAESKAHGVPVTEVHFHEVGTMDAIADVTAVCMLIDRLKPQKIAASHINVGSGTVKCAHGIVPVPAPATANILEEIPYYSGEIKSELCTPTGAALLKHFVSEFGDMPQMQAEKCGFGMGMKDFEVANCVKIMLGEA